MKTRISSVRNISYELIVDNGKKGNREVLASMTLFDGTGCWMLTDIRLHRHRTPSRYSGGLFSDDISCHFVPADEEESKFVQGLLREFSVYPDGSIHWSTFEGLVRGQLRNCAWSETCHNGVGYFTKAEGLAYLGRIRKFWDAYEGDLTEAKIDNPHRQLNQSEVWFRAAARQAGE